MWEVGYRGRTAYLRDVKGLHDLASIQRWTLEEVAIERAAGEIRDATAAKILAMATDVTKPAEVEVFVASTVQLGNSLPRRCLARSPVRAGGRPPASACRARPPGLIAGLPTWSRNLSAFA